MGRAGQALSRAQGLCNPVTTPFTEAPEISWIWGIPLEGALLPAPGTGSRQELPLFNRESSRS